MSKRRFSPNVGSRFAALLVLTVLTVFLVFVADSAVGARKAVGCFESTVPMGAEPKFRSSPSRCVFIASGALDSPIPPSFAVQQIIKIDWKQWGGRRAEGRGKGYTSARRQPVPVTVTLSKPKRKCGNTVYSRVTFKYQFGISAQPLNLPLC